MSLCNFVHLLVELKQQNGHKRCKERSKRQRVQVNQDIMAFIIDHLI